MALGVTAVTGGGRGPGAPPWRARSAAGRHANRDLRHPLLRVRLVARVGYVRLETRAERVAVLLLPAVPTQSLLDSPVQQRGVRLYEAVGGSRVDQRRIPPGRERAHHDASVACAGWDALDREAELDVELLSHVDDEVPDEGRAGRLDAPLS